MIVGVTLGLNETVRPLELVLCLQYITVGCENEGVAVGVTVGSTVYLKE